MKGKILILIAIIVLVIFILTIYINNFQEKKEKFLCTEESRNAEFCIEIYQPVCGWNDPEKVVCITYPCATTYSNSCFSCQDENVLYWTEGECPIP